MFVRDEPRDDQPTVNPGKSVATYWQTGEDRGTGGQDPEVTRGGQGTLPISVEIQYIYISCHRILSFGLYTYCVHRA